MSAVARSKRQESTAAIHVSTTGAMTSAATKPNTTDGNDAIISTVGFTMARTLRSRNSEV